MVNSECVDNIPVETKKEILGKMLELEGIHVTLFGSVSETLAENYPDVFLPDLQLDTVCKNGNDKNFTIKGFGEEKAYVIGIDELANYDITEIINSAIEGIKTILNANEHNSHIQTGEYYPLSKSNFRIALETLEQLKKEYNLGSRTHK